MGEPAISDPANPSGLHRHFGPLQATALNVTAVVGAGVFAVIPLMLAKMPGPYALLGWVAAGALMIVDGMIWSELGATLPGSGGSYLYLLECFGRERWGRLMAFLFIWQFLISGPLEVASGLIAMGQFAAAISPPFEAFNKAHAWTWVLGQWEVGGKTEDLTITFDLMRVGCFGVGVLILALLYRRVRVLGAVTLAFTAGVLAVIGWILIEGLIHFDARTAFDFSGTSYADAAGIWKDSGFWTGLGGAMIFATYSYLGYYNVCYVGDEVRDPGRTIPRSIMLCAVLVCTMFVGLHLAMLGTVSWHDVPKDPDGYSLPAEFMRRIHGNWAVVLVSVLLIWSCAGAAFAALLGYSRIPYGAARCGHFFAGLGRVHPEHRIPHLSLLLVGGLTLFWSFFGLESVVNALVTTRILEQFVGQIVGVMLLRRLQPDRSRPYRIWLYPLPCALALAGWLFIYVSAGKQFIVLGVATLIAGAVVFLVWSAAKRTWPFG